ncbi:MAG: alpha-amylase [Chitinophagaceae bacterium]|nr:MAG: alpha-amylase [Chitinophagaceae bacterium]
MQTNEKTVTSPLKNLKNKTLIQFFEWYIPADSNHWNRFGEAVTDLLALGITAAWLPPAYKGTRGKESEGYDVYDIFDLGEFDQKDTIPTKYGSKADYINAVNKARKEGLKVYIDVVLNHMGGAEETEKFYVKKVDPADRTKFISDKIKIEAFTKFTFPGRKNTYSDFSWDYHCFTGVDHAVNRKEAAIYNIINEYGDKWEPLVDNEKGNFDYLILNDIETRNPGVRAEFKKWISWYYQTVPFDGVRLDAVKHMNPSFFIEWIDYLLAEVNPDLFVVGEYWLSDDLPVLIKYLEAVGNRMSLFDAPLQHNLTIASEEKEMFDLRNIFRDTLVSVHPELAITFVDNHDTQPLQSLEEYTQAWFRPHGYALILLRQDGYPCVFYPDIYGASYSGKNKADEDLDVQLAKLEILPALLKLRSQYAYGVQTDYFDAHDCIGWTRQGDSDHPNSGLAVLIRNLDKGFATKRMHVGQHFAGSVFYNFLDGDADRVVIDEEGYGVFRVDGAGVAVFIRA